MREIKFRAWILNEGEKFKSYTRITPNNKMVYDFLLINKDGIGNYDIDSCESIEIMQYTGLKDRNGKEIYEGDIVKWVDNDFEERMDKITWENGGLCVCNSSYTVGHYLTEEHEFEVIGSIYENPELLE